MEYKSCEEQQFIQFMSFQKQKTLCHLKFLQQETTPMIEGPPIHSRPPILDFSQELIERDLKTLHSQVEMKYNSNSNHFKRSLTRAKQQALKNL